MIDGPPPLVGVRLGSGTVFFTVIVGVAVFCTGGVRVTVGWVPVAVGSTSVGVFEGTGDVRIVGVDVRGGSGVSVGTTTIPGVTQAPPVPQSVSSQQVYESKSPPYQNRPVDTHVPLPVH